MNANRNYVSHLTSISHTHSTYKQFRRLKALELWRQGTQAVYTNNLGDSIHCNYCTQAWVLPAKVCDTRKECVLGPPKHTPCGSWSLTLLSWEAVNVELSKHTAKCCRIRGISYTMPTGRLPRSNEPTKAHTRTPQSLALGLRWRLVFTSLMLLMEPGFGYRIWHIVETVVGVTVLKKLSYTSMVFSLQSIKDIRTQCFLMGSCTICTKGPLGCENWLHWVRT